MHHRLGGPLPHQLANAPQAHPYAGPKPLLHPKDAFGMLILY